MSTETETAAETVAVRRTDLGVLLAATPEDALGDEPAVLEAWKRLTKLAVPAPGAPGDRVTPPSPAPRRDGNAMTETGTKARITAIRDRLNEIAPYQSDEDVTAAGLARMLAVQAQEVHARLLGMDHEITMADIFLVQARFAAARALSFLAGGADEDHDADLCAAQIRDAWEDGGGIGEWLYEHLGDGAEEVAKLCAELATLSAASLAGANGDLTERGELEKLRDSCRMLGSIVSTDSHLMFAARIEAKLNGPEAAMQWILNGSNDLADQDAGRPWDGKESAQEWFDAVEAG